MQGAIPWQKECAHACIFFDLAGAAACDAAAGDHGVSAFHILAPCSGISVATSNKKGRAPGPGLSFSNWLRGLDLNQRPPAPESRRRCGTPMENVNPSFRARKPVVKNKKGALRFSL
jgi:hypothetical protein